MLSYARIATTTTTTTTVTQQQHVSETLSVLAGGQAKVRAVGDAAAMLSYGSEDGPSRYASAMLPALRASLPKFQSPSRGERTIRRKLQRSARKSPDGSTPRKAAIAAEFST